MAGAAGFIGYHLSKALLGSGSEVVGIDNLNKAYDTRLKSWRLRQLTSRRRFRFQRSDISSTALRPSWSDRTDVVVNLAARAGVRASAINPRPYVSSNIQGAVSLLEICRRADIPRFVLASTSSVYDQKAAVPFGESAPTEDVSSPYAATKKAAELLAKCYGRMHGISITILRYFTVYGPAGRPDMSVFRFIQGIREGKPITVFGDGTVRRDFTYVDDIVDGTRRSLELSGLHTINLGGDNPVSLNRLISEIADAVGRAPQVRHQPANSIDAPVTWADVGLARRLLGWAPKVNLRDGIKRTFRWYEENRRWAKRISLGKIP